MARFDHYPPHVRKRIAIIGTVSIGVVLVVLMIILYAKPSYGAKGDKSLEKLHAFYTTIIRTGQSYFGGN